MGWLEWIAALLLFLIGAAFLLLAIPVTYRLMVEGSGAEGQVNVLGGLWRKTFRYEWCGGNEHSQDEEMPSCDQGPLPAGPPEPPIADASSADIEKTGSLIREEEIAPREERPADSFLHAPGRAESEAEEPPPPPAEEEKEGPSLWETFRYGMKNGAVREALSAVGSLWRHSRPNFCLVRGVCGLGEPMETGVLAGWVMTAVPAARGITWDYMNMRCRLEAECRGRIIPIYVFWRLLRLAVAAPIRDVWRFRKKGGPHHE